MNYESKCRQKQIERRKLYDDHKTYHGFSGGYYYDYHKKRIIRAYESNEKHSAKIRYNRRNRRITKQMLKKDELEDFPSKYSNDMSNHY